MRFLERIVLLETMEKTLMKRAVLLALVASIIALPAAADVAWRDGKWRVELAGGTGIHSGGSDRSGDYMLRATVEYEIPATSRCTLGLRLLPLFVYEQDERDEDMVWGAGVGLGARIYTVADEYRGFFAEVGAHALGHKHRIADNSSSINFLTGVGVGYKCKAGWHTVARWEHISNANLGRNNAGANLVSLGVGFTF